MGFGKISSADKNRKFMIVTKIGCSGTYLIGLSNFKKYWVEGELSEGENEIEEIDKLEKKLDELYERNHVENKGVTTRIIQPSKKLTTEQQIIISIEGMETLEALERYLPYAEKNPVIKAAYDLKLIQLNKK